MRTKFSLFVSLHAESYYCEAVKLPALAALLLGYLTLEHVSLGKAFDHIVDASMRIYSGGQLEVGAMIRWIYHGIVLGHSVMGV